MVLSLWLLAATVKLLVIMYLLGLSVSQLIYGSLSGKYGRKPIIIISLLLAVLGNILTAGSNDAFQLLACRVLVCLGAGGCPAIGRAVLRDSCSDKNS